MGALVYTSYSNEKEKAIKAGADLFVLKNGMSEYTANVLLGTRIGLARQIVRSASRLGASGLPRIPVGEGLTVETEQAIFHAARETATSVETGGPDETPLVDLLRRRGWWQKFDVVAYSQLTAPQQLAQLVGYVGIQESELAQIVGISARVAGAAMPGEGELLVTSLETLTRHDMLLSVLGYALRVSGYEPDIMRVLWSEKSSQHDLCPPPWAKLGLHQHLIMYGPTGMRECLKWIRSH